MLKLFIVIFLLPITALSQTPVRQGLKEYTIYDKTDTINFYIYNPQNVTKTKIFLYLQGTGAHPMVNADDSGQCCMNNFPKSLMKQFPPEYAFVYINKVGLPYYIDNPKFEINQEFINRNNVLDRARVANKVIEYLVKNIYPKVKIIAVLGHSEGTQVIAKLVTLNSRITHICYAAGSGHSHLYDEVQLIRHMMTKGDLSAQQAQSEVEELYAGIDSVLKDPGSTTKYFRGDTYKWWYEEINHQPVDNLIKLKIPILLIHGSGDPKVPIEGADYIKEEFRRQQKENLIYKVYLNSDHDFTETSPTGERKEHWNEIFFDFIKFVDAH